MPRSVGLVGACIVLASCGCLLFIMTRAKTATPRRLVIQRAPLLPLSAPGLKDFVEKRKASKQPETQDLVSAARIRLAYHSASKKDWVGARATFKAAANVPGTGEMSPDWGTLPDQAAYQAAVCLVAEHKEAEARKEFIRFIKNRPLSPLVHACYSRLVRLNGGEPTSEYENLLQAAITKQEASIRFETSACGPKTIEYVLRRLGKPLADYKHLAKLCATNDHGTTIEGMRKGLRASNVPSFAYRLSRDDLAKARLPAIILEGDHYLALTAVSGDKAVVYDTRYRSEREVDLPPLHDPDFSVFAIVFQPISTPEF